jgi:uncharacterized protein YgiM (DUF1202 family)
MAKESEKLDIEDIKDPLDEADKKEEVDLEEAVAEEDEAPKEEEKVEEVPSEEEPDELEKAVSEPVVEEPKEEKKKDSGKKKDKKPFPWKTVGIVAITFLVTAALIMGGIFLYQKYSKPKEEAKTETTNSNNNVQINVVKPEISQKVVYVTSSDGLNLRKEPSASAEKLTTIPYGTKLDVLATQGTWYKVTYNNLTGWVDSQYTGVENPLVYKNTKYQFQITFPTTWGAYKVFEGGPSEVAIYYFGLPTTDKNWQEANITPGYASLMAVTVYSKAQYDALKAEGGQIGNPVATKGDYVLLASPGQAYPTDLKSQYGEVSSIIKTIKFY